MTLRPITEAAIEAAEREESEREEQEAVDKKRREEQMQARLIAIRDKYVTILEDRLGKYSTTWSVVAVEEDWAILEAQENEHTLCLRVTEDGVINVAVRKEDGGWFGTAAIDDLVSLGRWLLQEQEETALG